MSRMTAPVGDGGRGRRPEAMMTLDPLLAAPANIKLHVAAIASRLEKSRRVCTVILAYACVPCSVVGHDVHRYSETPFLVIALRASTITSSIASFFRCSSANLGHCRVGDVLHQPLSSSFGLARTWLG
jgi:hypothetical protein